MEAEMDPKMLLSALMSGDATKSVFKLTVKTSDKAAEKFILDGQFHRVASAVGEESVFELPAGFYTVKIRAGSDYEEKPVLLFEDQTVVLEPIQFASPAPLEGTGKTHEYQIDESRNHSNKIHRSIGHGSGIYVFARAWTQKNYSSGTASPHTHPLQGLKLCDKQGNTVVDLAGYADSNLNNPDQEPWAACNIELDPGVYRLSLEISPGNNLQQTVVASPGWQTQLFMLQRNYGFREKELHADLAGSSIFMARTGAGFASRALYPDAHDFRLIDIMRQALKDKRNVLSDDTIGEIIHGKFNNPMLGIYGAHLLLLDKKFEHLDIREIVHNLRQLLILPHPDVEAIALKLDMPSNYVFDVFPMLANSWNFVLEASVTMPEIVASNTLASQYAGQFWNCDLWLIWGRAREEKTRNLYEQVKSFTRLTSSSLKSNIPPDLVASVQNELSPNPRGLDDPESIQSKKSAKLASQVSNQKILPIVQALGVPRGQVEEILNEINLTAENEPLEEELAIEPVDDPQKGRWGGKSERDSRKITATVEQSTLPQFYVVTIIVESTDQANPLTGEVIFHLHDTFLNPEPAVAVQDGKAVLALTKVWGSFTVGAEADEGKTKLELDLAQLPGIPQEFKER